MLCNWWFDHEDRECEEFSSPKERIQNCSGFRWEFEANDVILSIINAISVIDSGFLGFHGIISRFGSK